MQQARKAAADQPQVYERHRPEQTLLYQLVETHYPELLAQLEAQGQALPAYVQQEFDDFLKCGRLEPVFCEYVAKIASTNVWWHSVANGAVSAPAAAPDAWSKVRRCWSMTCCQPSRYVSGC